MTNYSINIIISIFSFFSIFITFSVVVNFWGRLVLLGIKSSEEPYYGKPFVFITGLTAIVFLCCLSIGWIDNYNFLLKTIFYIGLLGFLIEFIKFILTIKNRKNEFLLKNIAKKYNFFLTILIQSLILVFIYSAVWPSGRMEVWLSKSSDFYYWTLMSDYLMGKIDLNIIPLSPLTFKSVYDSVGTHFIFGLFTFASNETALYSWPTLAVTLLVWSGVTIQNLVSKIFGLGFWASLLVASCVISGAFYNYIVASGMLGQLIAMLCFLVSLDRILTWKEVRCPGLLELKELFPPLFLIFLAYQGGYFAFVGMLAVFSALTGFFIFQYSPTKSRLRQGIIWGILPMAILTLVSSILEPVIAIHLFNRTFEVAVQKEGWLIPFLDPWLLSGLPIFKLSYFTQQAGLQTDLKPLAFVLFIIIILFTIFIIYIKRKIKIYPINDKINIASMLSISIFFAFTLFLYLISYLTIGNKYQIWKFASFICLPISFIPFSLFIYIIIIFWYSKKRLFSIVMISSMFIYFIISSYSMGQFIGFNKRLYEVDIHEGINNLFEYIYSNTPNDTLLALYLKDYVSPLIFAEIYKNHGGRKVNFLVPLQYYFYTTNLHQLFIDNEKLSIVSDRKFTQLFNSERGEESPGEIFLYDKDYLRQTGFISTFGIDIHKNWEITPLKIFKIIVDLPLNMYNKNVKLKVSLKMVDDLTENVFIDTKCFEKVKLTLIDNLETTYSEEGSLEIVTAISSEVTEKGYFSVMGRVLDSNSSSTKEGCSATYILDRVELEEDKNL
jgi:hypothetical protein